MQYFGNDMERPVWWALGRIGSIEREEKYPPAQLHAFGSER